MITEGIALRENLKKMRNIAYTYFNMYGSLQYGYNINKKNFMQIFLNMIWFDKFYETSHVIIK